ncbi:hypothetical protein VTK56DRAFT_683 [Thermocarpiscus australiensis]
MEQQSRLGRSDAIPGKQAAQSHTTREQPKPLRSDSWAPPWNSHTLSTLQITTPSRFSNRSRRYGLEERGTETLCVLTHTLCRGWLDPKEAEPARTLISDGDTAPSTELVKLVMPSVVVGHDVCLQVICQMPTDRAWGNTSEALLPARDRLPTVTFSALAAIDRDNAGYNTLRPFLYFVFFGSSYGGSPEAGRTP